MNRPINRQPEAHVPAAAALIGALAVLLAAGLTALGALTAVDTSVGSALAEAQRQPVGSAFPKSLPAWGLWSATTFFGVGLAWAMLSVPGVWRRVVLWICTLLVVVAWAPVLALAAHRPSVGAPLVAVLWVGVCVWFYASKHRLPCDGTEPPVRAKRISGDT